MRITRIVLENFRNYKKNEVNTDSDLVLILGDNAAGKTNFLESIYYLSALKSFRSPDSLLPTAGEEYFRILGAGKKEFELAVQVKPSFKRALKVDGQKASRNNWQSFANVLFVPSDLNLFFLGPALRRKFLDDTISQVKKEYAADLLSLDHILKQRSALLEKVYKNEARPDELDLWDQQLADVSARISSAREVFINFLQHRFLPTYTSITNFQNEFAIDYSKCCRDKFDFMEHLGTLRDAEIRSGQNLLGPHREDFTISKDGQLNIYNSSRGELRSQILTLKLLQAEYLDSNKQTPVILLDDVFSELDESRRTRLLESLGKYQVFITSTEEHHLPKLKSNVLVLKAAHNEIKN